ncbi:MAG: HAD-IIB family hydrolase [Erysipelotrichaceae bacterium]|nr:HAD-IIB family hydrolase [Erysipelotrichaceae bacterium]
MKKIKLLVADIDGTLVNEPREMMPITRKALKILHEHGILLGIASGRPLGPHMYSMARDTWGMDHAFDFYIGMNGGQIHDALSGQDHGFYQLQPEDIREIVEMMEPVDANPFIYIGEDMKSKYIDDMMYASMKRHGIGCEQVKDLSELWEHETPKILFRLKSADQMSYAEKYAAEHKSERYAAFKTQPTMLEFQDSRVNKGIALKYFCDMHHIDLSEVIAFGDMTNDNELLQTAGYGVCLKNGSDDTKAIADAVTEYTNNEDGMGRWLSDHLLNEYGWGE